MPYLYVETPMRRSSAPSMRAVLLSPLADQKSTATAPARRQCLTGNTLWIATHVEDVPPE